MTLSLGRVGLNVTLNNPSALTMDGPTVRIAGPIRVGSVADLKTIRKQLVGLVDNPWEPVVPVAMSTDTDLGGFYRVLAADVSMPPWGYRNGFGTFTATLAPVPAFANPLREHALNGADRNNSLVSADPWWTMPSTWAFIGGATTATDIAAASRVGPGGTCYIVDSVGAYDTRIMTRPPVSSYYTMAATISDSSGNAVVGSFLPTTSSVTISNGLLKLDGLTSLTAPIYATPASWGTATTIEFGHGSTITAFTGDPVILRNCPEEVVVRYVGSVAPSGVYYPVNLDISLRRGSRFLSCTFSTPYTGGSSTAGGLGVQIPGTDTNVTQGLRVTSNDGNGNRTVAISGNATYTTNTTTGVLRSTDDVHAFMVGHEVGGSSAADPDRVADVTAQFFAAMSETGTFVSP